MSGTGSNSQRTGQHARGTVGLDFQAVKIGCGAAQPLGFQLVTHNGQHHGATATAALVLADSKGTTAQQRAGTIVSVDPNDAWRCSALLDLAIDYRGTGLVIEHPGRAGERDRDISLATGRD